MKGKNAIISILAKYPELADEWIEDENRNKVIGGGYTYFPDITIEQLRNIAQNNLFKNYEDLRHLARDSPSRKNNRN